MSFITGPGPEQPAGSSEKIGPHMQAYLDRQAEKDAPPSYVAALANVRSFLEDSDNTVASNETVPGAIQTLAVDLSTLSGDELIAFDFAPSLQRIESNLGALGVGSSFA